MTDTSHIDSLESFFSSARLYVLVDSVDYHANKSAPRLCQLVRDLIAAGTSLIQLRDKNLSDRDIIAAGRLIAALTRGTNTRFILNDQAELAVAAGADGVHLGQDDQPVAEAKLIFENELTIFGVSTHSIEQARSAVNDGADYIGVGPVFHSQTKSFKTPVGLELVRLVANEIKRPAFAIGGIDLTNVSKITEAGMNRVAVSAAVVKADHPMETAREFVSLLQARGF